MENSNPGYSLVIQGTGNQGDLPRSKSRQWGPQSVTHSHRQRERKGNSPECRPRENKWRNNWRLHDTSLSQIPVLWSMWWSIPYPKWMVVTLSKCRYKYLCLEYENYFWIQRIENILLFWKIREQNLEILPLNRFYIILCTSNPLPWYSPAPWPAGRCCWPR